ncbi:phage tail tip fiber protein [Janthinobacterium sp. HLX7-2]|uniref:phage tail tip fiber protein n=1 Tax=Janthinobacterium sp. HLX7-2 TaxID=1259331 RepID=UPI003F1F9590
MVGERDTLIMNTVPRYAAPIDRALKLTPSATMFEVSVAGAPTPTAITFSALMLGAVGEITFSSVPPVPLTVANGDAVLKFEDMTASIVTITATTVIDGLTYYDRQTVSKQQALDLTPPPAPTGLVATGTPATIVLHWDAAPGNYSNLSHTEIWRAQSNNFAMATLAGRSDGREYIDPVGPGATRCYWIRYVSRAAIPGPYNAGSGTIGSSDAEVEHLLGVLTGQITQSQLYADLGARINLIDGPASTAGSVAARVATEATARTQALAAEALARTTGITAEQTSRTDADGALSTRIDTVVAANGSTAAAVTAEQTARANADGALGTRIDTVVATSSGNTAAITAEQTTRANADSALGVRVDTVAATTGSNTAAITAEQTARANADGALSGRIDTISASAGANTAAIQVEAQTRATQTGDLYAQYTVKQDVNGYVSGYGLATTANNATPSSAFAVRADAFYIASPSGPGVAPSMPFIVRTTEIVIDGVTIPIGVYIANAYIQNASITNAKIGGDIWSSNFVAGSSGWRLYRSGDMEINNLRARGSIAGGAFTGYAWPANGGLGYFLGEAGLLLGNPGTGRYFQINGEGDVAAPGFTIINGKATFSGNVVSGAGTGFRVEMGPDDPIYAMWAGSGAKTDANAIFYLKRGGSGYFGGSLSAGALKTAVTNPEINPNAQLVDGPFGSNGGAINVVCSLSWIYARASTRDKYTAGAGTNTATITLYRTIGGGAEQMVQTGTFSGPTEIINTLASEEKSTCQQSIQGSFTYMDTAASTLNRTYRAVLSLTIQAITVTPRPGGTGSADQDSVYQRLTLITTE